MNSLTLPRCPSVLPVAAVVVTIALAGCQTTQGTRPDIGTATNPDSVRFKDVSTGWSFKKSLSAKFKRYGYSIV